MKHNYLILLCLISFFVSTNIYAQTTLNVAGVPRVGQEMEVFTVADGSSITQGSSGENEWRFCDLPSDSMQIATFILPENTPYVSGFPDAELALIYANQLNFGSTPLKYEFFSSSPSGLLKHGEANVQGVVVPLFDPLSMMTYPFTFQNTVSDQFAGNYVVNGTEIERFGNIEVVADGYGSIELPYGKVEDVLRVKSSITYEEIVIGSGITFNINIESYAWYHPKLSYPIMHIVFERAAGSSTTVVNVSYTRSDEVPFVESCGVGIDEDLARQVSLTTYPNPATDQVLVNYELVKPSTVSVNVYNALGQLVLSPITNESQYVGSQSLSLSVEELVSGMYFVEVQLEEGRVVKPLIVK